MLNQLIYTRCMPQRVLKNKGQVVRKDGFGIFSMSQELVINPPISSYDLLEARLAVPNGAKENSTIGLINSYEYTELAPDVYALSYEVSRPRCKELRKNGQSHRNGTFIKQCLVGKPDDYPYMWFGASVWDAYKKSENDYYLDEDPRAEPAWLNTVQEKPSGTKITDDEIKNFVKDGRSEAVKSGIWFLINEYAKPENERKVLLIKDYPENVELWIAAIERAFSVDLAKKITFSTNKTNLVTQTDSALFYYTDESGKFSPILNRSIGQNRHPYNMISGYHPQDKFSNNVKQTTTSNFVIIDGTTKSAGFATDDSINSAYYSAAVKYDQDIIDFTNEILPSLPISDITDEIPSLYKAYKYLFDSNHKVEKWDYSTTVTEMQVLTQFGFLDNYKLNNYVLNEGLRGYSGFVHEDEKNDFVLLKYLWEFGRLINRTKDVTWYMADFLNQYLLNLKSSGKSLSTAWNAIKAAGVQAIVQPALITLFNDNELSTYSNQFEGVSTTTISTLLDMYYYTLNSEKNGINSILYSNEKKQFISRVFAEILDDRNALKSALNGIKNYDEVVNTIALSVSQHLEMYRADKTEKWWDAIIELSGSNIMNLSRTLCRSPKTSIDLIERLLANGIRKAGQFEKDYYNAFRDSIKTLGKNENTGKIFFGACLDVLEPTSYDSFIRYIRENKLSVSVEKELFRKIDFRIPYETNAGLLSYKLREINEWAEALGERSISVAYFDLRQKMEKERKSERVLPAMYDFSNLRIGLPAGFIYSTYFDRLAHISADLNDPEVYFAFINLFDIPDDKTKQNYIRAYIKRVLDCCKGKQQVYTMIAFCELFSNTYKIPGKNKEQLYDSTEMFKECFAKELSEYNKWKLADQVQKVNNCDPEAKQILISMLNDTGQTVSRSGLDRFLGLFRRN